MSLPSVDIEQHPLQPFLPPHARLLMLGSFPPQRKRWSMEFYYPNWNNDMWRLTGLLFFGQKDYFVAEGRKAFCKERLVEFLFLEVVTPTDVAALLRCLPECRAVVTTGEKATDTLCAQLSVDKPRVGDFSEFLFEERALRLYRMPSSSRAYPLALEKKAAAYRVMYQDLGML